MTSGQIPAALFGTRQRDFAVPDQPPNNLSLENKMTKQLIAIAFAAAFGIAHAADVKPAAAEMKAATPVAATVKAEAPKAAETVKAPEAKPAVAAPEMKKAEAKPATKPVKKAHKEKKMVKKSAPVAAPDATKAVEPAAK